MRTWAFSYLDRAEGVERAVGIAGHVDGRACGWRRSCPCGRRHSFGSRAHEAPARTRTQAGYAYPACMLDWRAVGDGFPGDEDGHGLTRTDRDGHREHARRQAVAAPSWRDGKDAKDIKDCKDVKDGRGTPPTELRVFGARVKGAHAAVLHAGTLSGGSYSGWAKMQFQRRGWHLTSTSPIRCTTGTANGRRCAMRSKNNEDEHEVQCRKRNGER